MFSLTILLINSHFALFLVPSLISRWSNIFVHTILKKVVTGILNPTNPTDLGLKGEILTVLYAQLKDVLMLKKTSRITIFV